MCVLVSSGLAEVMAGLGVEKLDKLMPDVVQTASKIDIASHVRDGYIMMFIYLPLTFGDKFTPYVGPIIPCILKVLLSPEWFVLLLFFFAIFHNHISLYLTFTALTVILKLLLICTYIL